MCVCMPRGISAACSAYNTRAGEEAKDTEHVLVGFYSSRALCRLVLLSRKSSAAAEFVRQLWEGALQKRCSTWLGTHADKVRRARVLACFTFQELKMCLCLERWYPQG